jgi:small conductance mechanosensitive channel
MNIQLYLDYLATAGISIGLKILGALAVFFVGRWLIGIIVRMSRRAMEIPIPEPTLNRYIGTLISVLLHIGLVISILGFFGFETTTFAALLAGVGLAIGTAWGGLLANFAAGIFLVALRPFNVGDSITVGAVSGTVQEIGIFITKIHAADNTVIYVGNNKIFSDNIQNHTANEYRRIDARLTLSADRNPIEMIRKINEKLAAIPGVLQNPAPQVGILEVLREGTTIAVRPYADIKNFQQVLFETNRMLFELLEENKKETP